MSENKNVAAQLKEAYDKVSIYPETRGFDGLTDLLILRNLVPQAIAALTSGSDALGEPASRPIQDCDAWCPRCNGSGEETVLSDNGPDAHEQTINCQHCDGHGTLYRAYTEVVRELAQVRKVQLERDAKEFVQRTQPVAYVGYGGDGKDKTLLLKQDLPVGTSLYADPIAADHSEQARGMVGLKQAAEFIQKKADDYAREFGKDDMGSLSFGNEDMLVYHWHLLELADEIRALAPLAESLQGDTAGASEAEDEDGPVQPVEWDRFPGWLIDHHEGEAITEELLQHALADMLNFSPANTDATSAPRKLCGFDVVTDASLPPGAMEMRNTTPAASADDARDAARYRWLRATNGMAFIGFEDKPGWKPCGSLLDEAIDESLRAGNQGENNG